MLSSKLAVQEFSGKSKLLNQFIYTFPWDGAKLQESRGIRLNGQVILGKSRSCDNEHADRPHSQGYWLLTRFAVCSVLHVKWFGGASCTFMLSYTACSSQECCGIMLPSFWMKPTKGIVVPPLGWLQRYLEAELTPV